MNAKQPAYEIPETELEERFIRSSGPGGQNVNKVATAVQLSFDVISTNSLPADVRMRLMRIAGHLISKNGILTITAQRFRTQEHNRRDARERLTEFVRQAIIRPKPRIKTRPSASSRRKRIENKNRQSGRKELRRRPGDDS